MPRAAKPKRRPLSAQERGSLRFAAETYYTFTSGDVSIAALSRMEEFAGVGEQTLQRWAKDGQWLLRRQQHQDHLRLLLRRRLSQSLIEDRVQQMEDQQRICDQGMGMMDDETLQPKGGWESVAGTVVSTMRNMEQMRQGLIAELSGGQAPEAPMGGVGMSEPLDIDEARAAARALVETRQRKLRAMAPPDAQKAV